MDFHTLARKELQALCKKNKIPANMANLAMADALQALDKVEGLDELTNGPRSDPQQSPERTTNGQEPKTACRTSTRRKLIIVEPESSQPLTRTRRVTRRTAAEEAEQENKNVNLPETPAMPPSRRRAPAASARRKMDTQLMESGEDEQVAGQEKSDVPETPAVQNSRRGPLAISTRKKNEAQKKDEKSVQKAYGTRQSVRLLEKSLADLSLKENRRVEAVKIEGLGEEAEEVEQKEDVTGGDSEVLSCQNKDDSLENENAVEDKVDDKTNEPELDESEVFSCQNMDQSIENESETKPEVQKDSKTNDHEVDNPKILNNLDQPVENEGEIKHELHENKESIDREWDSDVLCQSTDQLLKRKSETKSEVIEEDEEKNDHQSIENEGEIKHELHQNTESTDDEGDSDVLCQSIDQLLKRESETNPKLIEEDKEKNDHEVVDCNVKLSESCTKLDNHSGIDADHEDYSDSSDESFSVQVETSEKTVDMNNESIDENGPDAVMTENSETLVEDSKSEIEKELNGNQESLIVEVSDDICGFVMGTEHTPMVDVLDEVSVGIMDPLTSKISGAMAKSSETNLLEDNNDDLHSQAAIEEDSIVGVPNEVSVQVTYASTPKASELVGEISEINLIDDGCDDADGKEEVSDGYLSEEVQENDSTEAIQKAPLLPEADYENSQGRTEPESPRFEKCEEASDNLNETEESDMTSHDCCASADSDETPRSVKNSPFCPLASDSEVAGKIPLVDDRVIPEQEFSGAAYGCIQTLDKTPTSFKQMSPYQPLVSGDKDTGGIVSSPFAANTIQGQFPRPTESTPRKSSTKKQTAIQKIIQADINKENIDNSGRKIEPKKDKVKKKKAAADEDAKYDEISLRKLSKMLKEKLQVANNNNIDGNVSKVGSRPALQKLPENCMAVAEPQHKS